MAYEIPFKDVATEIKPLISGINVTLDLDNISSSIKKAKADIIDVVGEKIWELMINHYNDNEHYNQEEEEDPTYIRLNNLVKKIQDPLIHFGLYRHFIWLIIRISNHGVTVTKKDDETTAFKYLTDEAKNDLISTAWEGVNSLIEFLNKKAIQYSEWTKQTDYVADQVVINDGTYYKAKADFKSGDTFTVANWTEIPKSVEFTDWAADTDYITDQIVWYESIYYKAKSNFTSGQNFEPTNWDVVEEPLEVIFWEWTESDQYTETKNLIFNDYKDFNNNFGIDKSAYFFVKARYLIQEIIEDEIEPRIEGLPTLQKELKYNNVSVSNEKVLKKIKRYVAYETIARACFRFDYHEIPRSIRMEVDHELKRSDKDKNPTFIKEKLSISISNKADKYLEKLEMYLDTLKRIAEPDDTDNPTEIVDANITELTDDDKFVSAL